MAGQRFLELGLSVGKLNAADDDMLSRGELGNLTRNLYLPSASQIETQPWQPAVSSFDPSMKNCCARAAVKVRCHSSCDSKPFSSR